VQFLTLNINVDVDTLLAHVNTYSPRGVELLTINFPDPLFKPKHKKRRVVTDDFVDSVFAGCNEGTRVFMQSDIQDVVDDMRESFRRHDGFVDLAGDDLEVYYDGWVTEDGAGYTMTEREKTVINKDGSVWKACFVVKRE